MYVLAYEKKREHIIYQQKDYLKATDRPTEVCV